VALRSELELNVRVPAKAVNLDIVKNTHSRESLIESLALPVGIIMLIVWAVATFALTAPGWVHALLMLGVFSVIWGVVARGTPPVERRDK
jgi:hypothetical protein